MFLLTAVFVGFSGYAFTWQWFTRLDDFYAGVPGPVAPSSALHVELRQRQLLTVLSRSAPRGSQSTMGTPRGSGVGDQDGTGPGGRQPPQLDLSIIDAMYEQAMAGPVCGPLLRLFLAEYIRYGESHGHHVVGVVAKPSCIWRFSTCGRAPYYLCCIRRFLCALSTSSALVTPGLGAGCTFATDTSKLSSSVSWRRCLCHST
jgi:hypothetical protein